MRKVKSKISFQISNFSFLLQNFYHCQFCIYQIITTLSLRYVESLLFQIIRYLSKFSNRTVQFPRTICRAKSRLIFTFEIETFKDAITRPTFGIFQLSSSRNSWRESVSHNRWGSMRAYDENHGMWRDIERNLRYS